MNPFEIAQSPWGGLPPLFDMETIPKLPVLMAAVGDLLWAVAYVAFVVIGFRQRTFAVPLLAVCLNFSWELAFMVFHPPAKMLVLLPHLAWLLIDALIVYQAIRYGKEAQTHPGVKKHFYLLFAALAVLSVVGEQTMHRTFLHNSLFPDSEGHMMAFIINFIMSFLFISFLMGRPDMRGISILGAWTKMLGTGLVSAGNLWIFFEVHGRQFEMQYRETVPGAEWQPGGLAGGNTMNFGFYYFLCLTIFLVDFLYVYLVYRRRAELKANSAG